MQLGIVGLGRMGGNIVRRLDARTAINAWCSTAAPTRCAALAQEGADSRGGSRRSRRASSKRRAPSG